MRAGMIDCQAIRDLWVTVGSKLDERGRRVFAAMEVRAVGRGSLEVVSQITGLARSTIGRGLKDLDTEAPPAGRVGREGGGRRHLSHTDPTLIDDLRRLLEPATRGDPMRPMLWVSKSHEKLAVAMEEMGHKISANSVRRLLPTLGFRRQANRKADEGSRHPDRNGQFEHKTKGKVVPYGVYDVTDNSGWVSIGITHDTAEFAVQSIRCWLAKMGRERYPHASELMITADCGGSNGARVRLWKVALQKLADETRLSISVCHYPPGTSKWNKIEHRLFCHITQNWRA